MLVRRVPYQISFVSAISHHMSGKSFLEGHKDSTEIIVLRHAQKSLKLLPPFVDISGETAFYNTTQNPYHLLSQINSYITNKIIDVIYTTIILELL